MNGSRCSRSSDSLAACSLLAVEEAANGNVLKISFEKKKKFNFSVSRINLSINQLATPKKFDM